MNSSEKPRLNSFFQRQLRKSSLLGAAIVSLTLLASTATAQNFPHIKTFGFDYVPLNNRLAEATWLAQHHDWIIGGGNNWDVQLYSTIKEANPDTKIMRYLAYHSLAPDAMVWMENWASNNGYDPENIYYHYHTDSEVKTLSGSISVPGFGPNGSATSLVEARARVRWNGGWVGINPTSITFRRAFEAYALYEISVAGAPDTFLDGAFLDTFDGIQNSGPWTSNLQNTIELNPDGSRSVEEVYNQVRQDLLDAKMELEAYLKQQTGNNSFAVSANAADADIVYRWFPDLYVDQRDKTMHLTIEYMVTSASGKSRIPRLRDVYDDLENGRQMLIRSQTNYTSTMQDIPYSFTSFILATHYLINHENAYFMYHEGSAANYGGTPYGNFRTSHWHQNMEVNIGVPFTRIGTDSWGASNTDRFYEFTPGSGNGVLAREYSNALVLAKFGQGGFANIGNNPEVYQLDGNYYPLLEDNTTGAAVSSVTLGESEGVILLKDPVISTLPRPTVTNSGFDIRP